MNYRCVHSNCIKIYRWVRLKKIRSLKKKRSTSDGLRTDRDPDLVIESTKEIGSEKLILIVLSQIANVVENRLIMEENIR